MERTQQLPICTPLPQYDRCVCLFRCVLMQSCHKPGSVFGEDKGSLQQVGPLSMAHFERADSFGGCHASALLWLRDGAAALALARSHSADSPGFVEVSQQQPGEAAGQRGLVGTCSSGRSSRSSQNSPSEERLPPALRWTPSGGGCGLGPQASAEARRRGAAGILLRAIRKSLITLNQDIPAFPLFVYRTHRTQA